MIRYEVCALLSGRKDKLVRGPFTLLDTAIEEATRISRQTPYDLLVTLVEDDRDGFQVRQIRGFVVRGRFDWAKRCDACLGRGHVEHYRSTPMMLRGPCVHVECAPCSGVGAIPECGLTLRPPPPPP